MDSGLATIAGYLDTEIAAILEDTGTTLPAAIAAIPTNPILDTEDGSSFTALPDVTLANGAHGGAAATLTLKSIAVTNSDPGGTAVGIVANGAGGNGMLVSGAAGDIVADIIGTIDTCTTNTDMRGTDSAALAATALSNAVWTNAKAAFLDMAITDIPTAAEIKTAIEAAGSHLALILEDTGTTIPDVLTVIDNLVDDLETRLTATRAGNLDELSAATSGKMAYYVAKMAITLINKMIVTEADGATEQFNDAGTSLGSIAAAFSSDGTFTTRKRMVI